jgi:hypothetical protein
VRNVAAVVPLSLLSACAFLGPRDGLVVVTGKAPTSEGTRCTVAVGPLSGNQRPQEREVEGSFKESFVVNRHFRGHFASLQCGSGVGLVAERRFKYGRYVEVGGEVPLDGRAP